MSRAGRITPAQLTAALRQLTDDQRAIFLAMASEEASYAEIAARTGMSVAEIEQQFAAALVGLDKALEELPHHSRWRRLCRRFVLSRRS